jgi:phospholipid/cholesterol/gamma-HCH transport system permease protein
MILSIRNVFISLGEYVSLMFDVLISIKKRPPTWPVLRDQLHKIGVSSFIVILMTGIASGVVLATQSFYQLSDKGMSGIIGIVVAKAMITELGPILTCLMITGRVGSAMCAELGTMKVTEQIDALHSMAVNPDHYLVTPRLLAGIAMIPILTMFSIVFGIIGGFLISYSIFDLTYTGYFNPIPHHISAFDITTGLAKSLFFGSLIITICCYKGMKTKGGAAGVGKATTDAVVISYVAILVSDFLLTIALNAVYLKFFA